MGLGVCYVVVVVVLCSLVYSPSYCGFLGSDWSLELMWCSGDCSEYLVYLPVVPRFTKG